jgi:hypothetical protein
MRTSSVGKAVILLFVLILHFGIGPLKAIAIPLGAEWTEVTLGDPPPVFSGRKEVIEFGEALHVTGTSTKPIYRSLDGNSWSASIDFGTSVGGWSSLHRLNGILQAVPLYTSNELWRSIDGASWNALAVDYPWCLRWMHGYAVMNGMIWIAGGQTVSDTCPIFKEKNDIWRSGDGITWDEVVSNAAWHERRSLTLNQFTGRLWVMGGCFGNSMPGLVSYNDIWSSSNGVEWVEELASAPWLPRRSHTCTEFLGKLWLIGGDEPTLSGTEYRDTWVSEDGIVWSKVESTPKYLYRTDHASVVFKDKLWVIGGKAHEQILNDTWVTADGLNWKLVPNTMPWHHRSMHGVVAFKGRLWVVGGQDAAGMHNDVWRSEDGRNWQLVSEAAPWVARAGHALVVHGDELWILGGSDGSKNLRDVWHSPDGIQWTEATASAAWPPRVLGGAASLKGQLWVLGGRGDGGMLFRDVWHSDDGLSWMPATLAAGWEAREDLSVTAHRGRLWVVGGAMETTGFGLQSHNDVWFSDDGIQWSKVAQGIFPRRTGARMISYRDKLWLAGGFCYFDIDYGPIYLNDVWQSEDGLQWTEVTPPAPQSGPESDGIYTGGASWKPRRELGFAALKGRLWVVGGEHGVRESARHNDVWVSASDEGQHSSDLDHDEYLNLSEVLRTVQLYNLDEFHCDAAGEDGYAPGAGDQICRPHSSDYSPQDWQISVSELLRTIQFYNSGGYSYCPAADPPTEDGYCPAGAS